MSQNFEKLKGLLAELFQLDQADLDFGIYRIMNTKREEITRFLNEDLLPQVQDAFKDYESERRSAVEAELAETIEKAKEIGTDPESSTKVKELRAKYSQSVDIAGLENDVYSHLYKFFRRYYHEGDFISMRRYKEGVYAIPYEGEEVKLHWANHDQYYIKTSEYLRNYTFKLPSGKRVTFKLVEADTENDNNRAAAGNERRFTLITENPLIEENGELFIRFSFQPDPDKHKQKDINDKTIEVILGARGFDEWRTELGQLKPTEKNPDRTLLEKHLTDYTARNTFDYFIHKDLGRFLMRELDFYIKNEVMHLDDIESETAPKVEQYLSKIKVIRKIAHKIIEFLAQIENFQKKLWLKKKFVVETNYCITLCRIFAIEDENEHNWLVDQIIMNNAQREEWVRLFAIDEIKGDLTTPGFSIPLKREFLEAHPTLVVDTRHFSTDFGLRLLAAIPNLDEMTDGLLIHGENFQGLRLMQERYRQQIKCVYIDPPYNTGGDGFPYKDSYRHSSWMSMFGNRLEVARLLLDPRGVLFIHIDNNEQARLCLLGEYVLGQHSFHAMIAWKNKYGPGAATRGIGDLHEHILLFCIDPAITLTAPLDEETIAQYSGRDAKFATRGGFVTQPLSTRSKDSRPNLIYPVVYEGQEIWPDKQWIWSRERMEAAIADDEVVFNRQSDDSYSVRFKQYLRDEQGRMRCGKPLSLLLGPFNQDGTKEIENLFGERVFSFPKPAVLGQRLLAIQADEWESQPVVLDYLAGSGTVGHAVINLNRENGGQRKFILVEMAEYLDTVLLPRIKKVIFTPDWKDGKPNRMATQEEAERSPRIVKVIRLESYEDTLNNLVLRRTETQQRLLDESPSFLESYMLSYLLDVESRENLLNIDIFEEPLNCKLNISTGTAGETKPVAVDLVETFNYLIGLKVKTIATLQGVRVVTGTNPQGENILILWRNIKEMDNDGLDGWFRKQGYNSGEQEFDIIYVNGDNNLENLRREEETWKVRLIEEEFKRLMFDVEDV